VEDVTLICSPENERLLMYGRAFLKMPSSLEKEQELRWGTGEEPYCDPTLELMTNL